MGWRDVPVCTEEANVGPAARSAEPNIKQLFIGAADGIEGDDFERQLYLIRKRSSHQLRFDLNSTKDCFFTSVVFHQR